MKHKWHLLIVFTTLLLATGVFVFARQPVTNDKFITYIADPKKQGIRLYWKDDQGKILSSIGQLKNWLQQKGQTLVFAMNGGMYQEDRSPLGLYIEEGKILHRINTANASGNFYLKPNGIFYLTKDNHAFVCTTANFVNKGNVQYATQSGPMLVIDGTIHPAFTKGSANINLRNGVGILPNGQVVFALSKIPVNLYDFAEYFKKLGCKNALYLDGFVSRMYLPQQNWIQTDGNFGVMIGVVSAQN